MGRGGRDRYLNASVRLPPNINIIHSNNPEAAMLERGGWRSVGVVGGGPPLRNEADNESKTPLLMGIKLG